MPSSPVLLDEVSVDDTATLSGSGNEDGALLSAAGDDVTTSASAPTSSSQAMKRPLNCNSGDAKGKKRAGQSVGTMVAEALERAAAMWQQRLEMEEKRLQLQQEEAERQRVLKEREIAVQEENARNDRLRLRLQMMQMLQSMGMPWEEIEKKVDEMMKK